MRISDWSSDVCSSDLVVVRNVAAGTISKRLGIAEGTVLPRSIVEYYYKNDELGDPLVSEEHITAFGWATPQDIDDMLALSLRVNDFLMGLFQGVGLKLIDFKLEYGRIYEESGEMRIVVADEVSPERKPEERRVGEGCGGTCRTRGFGLT